MTEAEARRILAVSAAAPEREIKSAWRRAVRESHPDRWPNDPGARARFDAIQEAHRLLTDPALIAQRAAARRVAPEPPFTVPQMAAFRALGLGPGATYREIEAAGAALQRGDARDADVAAHMATLLATRPEDPDRPQRRARRQPPPPPPPTRLPAVLLSAVIMLFAVGLVVLVIIGMRTGH